MQTRSQSKSKYPTIDFEDAHKAWMLNKKKMGNGTYVYICGKPLKNGELCKNMDKNHGCGIHTFWEKRK